MSKIKVLTLIFGFCITLNQLQAELSIQLTPVASPASSSAKTAQRIIALSPHAVELLYAIGAGDRIIATVEHADYPEQAKKIQRIGNYEGINIEQLLELQPDLIVAWKGGNKSSDLDKIQSLGFNLVYSQPEKVADISHDLARLGELTGQQQQAARVIEQFNRGYHQIRKKYRSLPPVSVFYQLWHDPLQSIGSKSWLESLIDDCGGVNIFHGADVPYPMVSIESVLVKNPQVIIIPHLPGVQYEKRSVWLAWPEINAVKNNHIFLLNSDLLHRTTPRTLNGLEELCKKIDQARNGRTSS